MVRRLMKILSAGLMLALLGGCVRHGYDLHLSLEPSYARSLGDDHVFVHVIPVTDANRWRLAGTAIDDYWRYGDRGARPAQREKGTQMFELSADSPTALLPRDDAAWDRWRAAGTRELMVLSSRPGPGAPADGGPDPRRRMLPAGVGPIGPDAVHLVVTPTGLKG